jgi:hypothetical protein
MPRKANKHDHPKHVKTANMPKGFKAFWQKVNAGKVKDPKTGRKKRHTA